MADLAAELGDEKLTKACEALWRDLTSKRMYVTAGLGPSAANEGFTTDYDLPNETAYAETCASVALIFWAQRMLNLGLDGAYADVMEVALYNGALAGLSRDGTHYFNQNPLESDGSHERWTWHPCPCCTMNVSRLVASVSGYFYSTGPDVVAVHLYGSSRAQLNVGGTPVAIRQETDFPWSGEATITIEPERPVDFALKLRIPSWARTAECRANGKAIDTNTRERGYLELRRTWSPGDRISLELAMPIERVRAHPNVRADVGRVALQRGPLIFCLEQVDNGSVPVSLFRLPRETELTAVNRSDLFDGIVTIVADTSVEDASAWNGELYRSELGDLKPTRLTAVPYFLWSNRGPGRMAVWIPECS
jgi:DUF1680 family protein